MLLRNFIDKFKRCPRAGWLDWDEAALLAAYAELTQGPIVEVGSYRGRSAVLLSQATSSSHLRTVYCVDPWEDKADLEAFLENTQDYSIMPLQTRVEKWVPIPAEFVFLDGDHTYQGTLSQVEKAILCQPRIIAAHDVAETDEGREVKRAVLDMLGEWDEISGKLAVWCLDESLRRRST